MNEIYIFASKGRVLPAWNLSTYPLSVWLHLLRPWDAEQDSLLVAQFIDQGSRYFLVSGVGGEEVEEHIDYIAMDRSKEHILTTHKSDASDEVGEEFILTRCPTGPARGMVLLALGECLSSEVSALIRMLKAIEGPIQTFQDLR